MAERFASVSEDELCEKCIIKQLFRIRFSHDIMNYQNRGLCYLPKPKVEADNTDLGSVSADNTDLGFDNS